MATNSTRKENRDTKPEDWVPVGIDMLKEEQ